MKSGDEEQPAAVVRTGRGPDTADTCDVCGTPIESEEWHPIASEWDMDGEFCLYLFCSEECRDAWDDS